MGAWAGRTAVAVGLVANGVIVPHPLALAVAQGLLAVVVLAGWGGTATLAVAALLLVPVPFAEARRWLGRSPLGCACQRSSGEGGIWAGAGAVADLALIGLCTWVARRGALSTRREAATGS